MSITEKIKRRIKRLNLGLDTRREFLLKLIDILLGKHTNFYHYEHERRRVREFKDKDFYRIGDIKMPLMDEENEDLLLFAIFEDTFGVYLYFNDDYHEEKINDLFYLFGEGPYGLINDKVNVTVETGDVVIDAGSWCGDFAAYASVKGATAYAFEPTDSTFEILKKTAELNGNIIPVKKGLSDENTSMNLFVNLDGNSGANALRDKTTENMQKSSSIVETITLDDFVRENNIERIDFIKSDIEGFERKLLAGAQETLRRFAPKLALCTYHLPDDPEVMEALIKQANPKYNVVQKRKKLFASVPNT